MRDVTIGQAARESGVRVNTIRFYEDRGLISAPPRSAGNRRLYGAAEIGQLKFIRHARDLGFGLDDIAELLALQSTPHGSCARADEIAKRQLHEVQTRIRRLQALGRELSRMVEGCDGSDVETCRVIESLSDHSHCETDHGRQNAKIGAN